MQKIYERINWENEPSTNTAISEDNLNKMDYAIDKLDDRVIQLAGYEERAKASEESAQVSEVNAGAKSQEAENYANMAQSYAVGGTGTRENEDIENAKFYYEQAERIAQGLSGTLLPCGTITFEELADVQAIPGYMYNISNKFTSDDRFLHSGIEHGVGANIYMTIEGKWDVLAGSNVISVNGKTGVVILKAVDIECNDGETVQSKLDKVGLVDELTTGVKDTIVKAINWLNNSLTTLSNSLVALTKRVSTNETSISGLNTNWSNTNSNLTAHTSNKSNPHGVTAAQIGLGNVNNTADSAKSVKYATSSGSAGSVTGVVPIANGGTGANNVAAAVANLLSKGGEIATPSYIHTMNANGYGTGSGHTTLAQLKKAILGWTLLGSVTGTTQVSLSSYANYTDLLVVVYHGDCCVYNIMPIKDVATANKWYYLLPGYWGTFEASIYGNGGKIQLSTVKYQEANVTASASMTVYAR